MLEIIGYIAAIGMGLVLGLTGSGGAILTVPILVYLFSTDALLATTYSLGIVGVTSLVGTIKQLRLGNVVWQTALTFGLASVVGVVVARRLLLPFVPDVIQIGSLVLPKAIGLLLLFAFLMLFAAYKMIKPQQYNLNEMPTANNPVIFTLKGLLIGLVTGFVGASGGFLIIPVLVLSAKLEMKQAIGTSLFIVMANCLIGFASSLNGQIPISWGFFTCFAGLAIIGILTGIQYATKISNAKLKRAFGWFVLCMGLFIVMKELVLRF